MATQLDELNPEIREEGLDTNVIAKKLPAKVGVGSTIFEVFLWIMGILPGLIFLFMKISAQKHFDQLQQRIQRNASQIDNYLEQRVIVLQNCARLLDKAIDWTRARSKILPSTVPAMRVTATRHATSSALRSIRSPET